MSEGMPDKVVGRDRQNVGGTIDSANVEGKLRSNVPVADEGREKDGTEARKIPKARAVDEQRVLGGGHGALGD